MIDDQAIVAVLKESVAIIERDPYEYATSHRLERVHVTLSDGRVLDLILKDLAWDRLLPAAKCSKPRFLHEPRREIETYRRVLPLLEAGPKYWGGGRDWLLVDKVPGSELWQVGEPSVWHATAAWLAGFHRRASALDACALNPHLLRYTAELFGTWPQRAVAAVDDRRLRHIATRYDEVIDRLVQAPSIFIHGELYPSNILITDKPMPVDWEMAAVGPPFLDLVALASGWPRKNRDALVLAYTSAAGDAPWVRGDVGALVDCCRLHIALQWLGWSTEWTPPPEHRHDWLDEAVDAATRLGL
jgi:hypothetical protein